MIRDMGGPTQSAPKRQTQVDSTLNDLANQVDLVCDLSVSLIDRLQTVVRPMPSNSKDTTEKQALVPLANRLDELGNRLARCANELKIVLDGLEL